MPYRIAGIDVHKKIRAVAVADVEVDGDFHFERQKIGTTPTELRRLADWLVEHDVDEVVMESTAPARPGNGLRGAEQITSGERRGAVFIVFATT
jgi:hypothetical protein